MNLEIDLGEMMPQNVDFSNAQIISLNIFSCH